MTVKNVFIGLGGSGIRTVTRLRLLLQNNEAAKDCGFIFIDADEEEYYYTNLKLGGVIKYSEFVLLNRLDISAEASKEAFWHRINVIDDILRSSVFKKVNGEEKCAPNSICKYWIVGSSCGGIGSGVAPELIRFLSNQHRDGPHFKSLSSSICLVTYTLDVFKPGVYVQGPMLEKYSMAAALFSKNLEELRMQEESLPIRCIPVDYRDENDNIVADAPDELYVWTAEMLINQLNN